MGPQKPGQGSAAKPPIPNLPLADGRVRVPGGTPDPGGRARSGSLPRICHSCGKGVASFPDPEGVKWVRVCGYEQMAVQFEAFCAGGLAPGWSLLVQGQADSGEDRFEINFLLETGDIAFHVKPRFSSATIVGNAFQGGCWGPEEVSSIFPLALGEPFEMEVSSDSEHFHVYAQEHKILQFPHRQRPLGAITRVRVLSDHHLAQVELAKRGLSWGDRGY
ncbi:grifin isoform X2 [Callithrix jacchus]|uniref:grifin isoform X2 n=1 Tax=Callithrix jacchus TaxID=9483 RepID=UPI00159DBDF6|nr:grifin isoform X2 [Callithrix jacchus]